MNNHYKRTLVERGGLLVGKEVFVEREPGGGERGGSGVVVKRECFGSSRASWRNFELVADFTQVSHERMIQSANTQSNAQDTEADGGVRQAEAEEEIPSVSVCDHGQTHVLLACNENEEPTEKARRTKGPSALCRPPRLLLSTFVV